MATSVTLTGYPFWVAGTSVLTDVSGRLHDVAAMTFAGDTRGGVLPSSTTQLAVAVSSGMSFTVAKGAAVIPSSGGATDGAYRAQNSASQTLTCTASDPTNPRIDLAVIQVLGTTPPTAAVAVIAGTPAPSPSVPSTPSNAIALAQIRVNAGVTSISAGNITDVRIFTAAAGGVVNCPNMASLPTGMPGQIGYDVVNDRFFELGAAGAKPFKTMGFTPGHVVNTNSGLTMPGNTGAASYSTLLSTSVTTDGSTDLMIIIHWPGVFQATAVYGQVLFGVFIDSTQVDEVNVATIGNSAFDNTAHGGGTSVYITSSAVGNTPSAAAHTIAWKGSNANQASSRTTTIRSNTNWAAYLRVQPVTL